MAELMKEYQRKFGDSNAAAKSGEQRIPIVRMILLFSVLPALAFTAVAAIENSFTLDNEGILIDDQGEHHGLIEWNGRLYVIGETNASALDLGVEHFENETDHPSDFLMLEERFENALDRCPKEEIEMSCEITNNGLLEDPIFLGYFPATAFMVLAAGPLIKGMHAVRRRLPHLVTFEGDEGGRSQLSQEDFMEVDRFFSCTLLSLLPWRKVAQSNELSPENLVRFNRLRRVPIVLSFLGFLFLLLGTKQHWTANQTYGFDIWASSHFLLGFFSRMAYEAILQIIFYPLIFYWLLLSIYLKHHSLTQLESKKGFKFIRFSHDEAGGMGEFGNQSLRNVLILLPLLIPILAYILYYPFTPLLVIGLIAFITALPVLFFWPLVGARRSMMRMKNEEVRLLADRFEREYYRHKMAILNSPNDVNLLAETGDALIRSEQIFQEINRLSTWPFSRTLIAKFASILTVMMSGVFLLFDYSQG